MEVDRDGYADIDVWYAGDSMVNGLSYLKFSDDWLGGYTYLLRIDVNKVYLRTRFNGPLRDELIYDFDLSVGDSVEVFGYGWMYVMAKETVQLRDGIDRIQLTMSSGGNSSFERIWVQGIGERRRGIEAIYPFFRGNIRCAFSDESSIILADDLTPEECTRRDCLSDCAIVNVEETSDDMLLIYPNPSSDMLYTDVPRGTELHIFNTSGVLIGRHGIIDPDRGINISDLNSGFYILMFVTKEGQRYRSNFLKN